MNPECSSLSDALRAMPPLPEPPARASGSSLTEADVYFVTGSTVHKLPFFDTPADRDELERHLLALAREHGWQLEAWAVFANHYHFVARRQPRSAELGRFLWRVHSDTTRDLNGRDGVRGRPIWHSAWDTRLTDWNGYLARLSYVHQNAVRHGLVRVANQYRWCSAAWFERVATPDQVKSIYSLPTDQVRVYDDF